MTEKRISELDNFRYLPISEKAALLHSKGKQICSLKSHGLKITLYCFNSCYVEVFNELDHDKLVGVRILENKKRLRFYARHFDLRDLLNQSITSLLILLSFIHLN
jgi:hypothetical protein